MKLKLDFFLGIMTNDACAGEYLLKIDMEVNFLLLWDQNCWLCGMAVTLAVEKC